jgi:hypothetical protein
LEAGATNPDAAQTMNNNHAAQKKILADAIQRSAWDPAFFLRFFLKSWFPSNLPHFHLGLIALITRKVEFLNSYPDCHDFLLEHFRYQADPRDTTSLPLPVFQKNEEGKIIMVAGMHNNFIIPRGFSKTTLLNGLNLYELCTDGTLFCVYIGKSSTHSEMQLGNIKYELESNKLLIDAYGNLVPNRADAEKWQADQIQLLNGAILVARGRGGQVRGLNFHARRPNRILLDDVEDDGTVDSPTVRTATESWFYSAVEKAGNDMEGATGEEWAQAPLQITNLGTLLGPQCLMMTLAQDPDFNTVKFGAKLNLEDSDDQAVLWQYKLSYEGYMAKRKRHQQIGRLAEFTRELDSSIRVSDDTIFPNTFIYAPTPLSDLVHRAMALDPAISNKVGADHATLVVAGRRASDGAIWMLDEWGGVGKTPRDKINAFFDYHEKWMTTHNGIEAVAYQASLIFLMKEEMAERRYFFPITPIMQGTQVRKDTRIQGMLSPRYTNGIIRHLRPLTGLESNLADWPNGKKDYADAAAMCLTLLGETQMLVIPEEERELGEYAPLEPALPPVFNTVNNYITGAGGSDPVRAGRYG